MHYSGFLSTVLAPQTCYCGEKTGEDSKKVENYFNGAIAGKDPLSQYIKHHCKEEGKGKDDQNLKMGRYSVQQYQYEDRTVDNFVLVL